MPRTVTGRGGHGAMPHATVDPVTCAAKIVVELQTIVSRETNPFEPTVVSVGSIHGGDAFNVIPERVRMTGTIRSLSLEGLRRSAEQLKHGWCDACFSDDYPVPIAPGEDAPQLSLFRPIEEVEAEEEPE